MTSSRNGSLDVLRAAAILAVLWCHVVNGFWRGSPAAAVAGVGGRGVDLFFVLSGWLLGRQLFKELAATGTVDVRRFWVRRWLRTLPAYFAVLLPLFAVLVAVGRGREIDWRYLVFLQNYIPEEAVPYFGVSWSLCVEEHFYLLIAPAVWLAGRSRWAVAVCFLAVAALLVLHAFRVYWPQDHLGYTRASQVWFEPCLTGVLLAWVAVNRPRAWAVACRVAPLLGIVALALVVVAAVNRSAWNWWLPDWGTLGWAAIFGAWVLLANSSAFWQTRVKSRFAGIVAHRAYSLYLVHEFAIAAARKADALPAGGKALLALALTAAAAEVLYRLVERPALAWRERAAPSKPTAAI